MKMDKKAYTGKDDSLLIILNDKIKKSESIDIIVSFIKFSGVRLIIDSLQNAASKGIPIRILTGTYLNITEPFALKVLMETLGSNLDLRLYEDTSRSFHPKAYFFKIDGSFELFIGSSNLSENALADGVEWNHLINTVTDNESISAFHDEFERLFEKESVKVDEKILNQYSSNWNRPKLGSTFHISKEKSKEIMIRPHDAQAEALYELNKTRDEGADKALIYAATGIGKTYLAAFDSKHFKKILFVAHREEILKQAQKAFLTVRPDCSTGFFTARVKDTKQDIIFASIATIGNKRYLNGEYFTPTSFDYIVIDEFHHAVAKNYKNVLEYFHPSFMLGLTATAERMDRQSIYSLCDYNVPYRLSLADAISRGFLVPFHYYGIYDDTVDYSKIAMANGRYVIKDLTANLDNPERITLIYKNYCKYQSKRALGFTSSKKQALFMAEHFTTLGIKATAVISGDLVDSKYQMTREEAIKKLEKEEIQVIFSVDMFNEGLDIPSVDLVMFLRPTESPVVFLQQLGRGLRISEGKEYLNVLDFIGNYNNAFLVPSLLSKDAELNHSAALTINLVPPPCNLPYGCIVDFDFRLIDLFRIMKEKELTLKERIQAIYYKVKHNLGHIPSRTELFEYSTGNELEMMFQTKSTNPFRDYLGFLTSMNDFQDKEFIESPAGKLINTIENTSMTKSYKIPILLAFMEGNTLKTSINNQDIIKSFKTFYLSGTNYMDMEKDKNTRNFKSWSDNKVLSLAMNNPVHFLSISSPEQFHINKKTKEFELSSSIAPYTQDQRLLDNYYDAVNLRKLEYYWKRFKNPN